MTVLSVFSIFDSKSDSFCIPFFEKNKAMATRAFMQVVSDPDSKIHAFPDDYSLFYVSTFDELTGKFEEFESPEMIMTGRACVRQLSILNSSDEELN